MATHELLNEVRKVDTSGRISLGRERAGEQYEAKEGRDGVIVLTPVAVIPKRELWIHNNPEAKASVLRGLEQSARGEGTSLGSFAQYAESEDDEE